VTRRVVDASKAPTWAPRDKRAPVREARSPGDLPRDLGPAARRLEFAREREVVAWARRPAPHLDGAEVFDDALTGRRRVTIPVAPGFDLVVEWAPAEAVFDHDWPSLNVVDLVDRFGSLEPRPDRPEPPEV